MIRLVKTVEIALDITFELSKLLQYSSKTLHDEIAPQQPGFCTLCPTRWTVRALSLDNMIKNYNVIQKNHEVFSSAA